MNEVYTRDAWMKKAAVGFCLTLAGPASSLAEAEARAADSSKERAKEKMENTQDKADVLHFNLIREKSGLEHAQRLQHAVWAAVYYVAQSTRCTLWLVPQVS